MTLSLVTQQVDTWSVESGLESEATAPGNRRRALPAGPLPAIRTALLPAVESRIRANGRHVRQESGPRGKPPVLRWRDMEGARRGDVAPVAQLRTVRGSADVRSCTRTCGAARARADPERSVTAYPWCSVRPPAAYETTAMRHISGHEGGEGGTALRPAQRMHAFHGTQREGGRLACIGTALQRLASRPN
jgi:hypothetical protein